MRNHCPNCKRPLSHAGGKWHCNVCNKEVMNPIDVTAVDTLSERDDSIRGLEERLQSALSRVTYVEGCASRVQKDLEAQAILNDELRGELALAKKVANPDAEIVRQMKETVDANAALTKQLEDANAEIELLREQVATLQKGEAGKTTEAPNGKKGK